MGEYTDKIKGVGNQIKGDLTGDDATKVKGVIQEKKGEIKGAFERVKNKVKDGLDRADSEA